MVLLGRKIGHQDQERIQTDCSRFPEEVLCQITHSVSTTPLKMIFPLNLAVILQCFWELVKRFTHRDVVSQLNHLGQITTEIGMCRVGAPGQASFGVGTARGEGAAELGGATWRRVGRGRLYRSDV